jgi:hypothetical protein
VVLEELHQKSALPVVICGGHLRRSFVRYVLNFANMNIRHKKHEVANGTYCRAVVVGPGWSVAYHSSKMARNYLQGWNTYATKSVVPLKEYVLGKLTIEWSWNPTEMTNSRHLPPEDNTINVCRND